MHNWGKGIADYLKSLCRNEYGINDIQCFPEMLRDLPPLKNDEEYVSYDVYSLFTNIPLEETIDYILEEVFVNRKMQPICSKLIFNRLLNKLTRFGIFELRNRVTQNNDIL